jgi:hypothetical protein
MNQKEFAKRRKQLLRMVGDDGIAILPSASACWLGSHRG